MGEQNLYEVVVSVTDETGELDRLGDRIGLRRLRKAEANGWACYLNGKRIFCRGPNYVSEQLQSTMTRARYEFDVQLMKDANMNMVRSYCVVECEKFYDVCDETGVMVYQDFPTTGRMSNRGDFLHRAVQQGRRMVNQLYHHPSIVLWSWGSQPAIKNFENCAWRWPPPAPRRTRTASSNRAPAYGSGAPPRPSSTGRSTSTCSPAGSIPTTASAHS